MPAVGAVAQYLDELAPAATAAPWDNVGLLLGDRAASVRRLMTCLTVTPASAAEAIAGRAELIVTHHPILFRPTQRLTADGPEGRLILELARAGIAVVSAHTAYDNCAGGINDQLARRLDLDDVQPLRPAGTRSCKFVVFVPDKDLPRVADALFAAGAGRIGHYSECSFRLAGTGTFFGLEAANPTIGQKGRREEVSEWRLEAVCPEERVEQVIAAVRRAHSYEEPAYDVYPLRPAGSSAGEGRVGRLARPLPLDQLARQLKQRLPADILQVVGEPERVVSRVALACGAAGELLEDALRAGADVFVTGELRFHDYLRAQAQGLSLVLPGHHATERLGVEELARQLQLQWPDVDVWASRQESDPVRWVS